MQSLLFSLLVTLGAAMAACADCYTKTFPAGYDTIASHFYNANNTLNDQIHGTGIPVGASIYLFDKPSQSYLMPPAVWNGNVVKWTPNYPFPPGAGGYIQSPSAFTYTFCGLPVTPLFPRQIGPGCCLIANQTNALATFEQLTGLAPSEGCKVHRFVPSTGVFITYSFDLGEWTTEPPTIPVGEAVFVCCGELPRPCLTLANNQLTYKVGGGYTLAFDFYNGSDQTVKFVYAVPIGNCFNLPKKIFPLATPVGPKQYGHASFKLGAVSFACPSPLCLRVSTHTANFTQCCSVTNCFPDPRRLILDLPPYINLPPFTNILVITPVITYEAPPASVDFRLNGGPVFTDSNAPYSYTLSNLPPGLHLVVAVAYFQNGPGFTSVTSAPVTINTAPAPVFSRPGGMVAAGVSVFMSNAPGATIYYTLDGTDPRLPNGNIAPAARSYSGPITITTNVAVFARARWGSVWSDLTLATYVVSVPSLRITEIMYNPDRLAGSTNDPQDFEYLELKNIGPTTLNLNGVRFTNGISFNFTGSTITNLTAGARVLVVKNLAAFVSRYGGGLPVAGQYGGSLANDGERLALVGPVGEPILDFSFHDEWFAVTDGPGFSLVIVDENASTFLWSSQQSWRPSGVWHGSPGAGDTNPPSLPSILVNEAFTRSLPPAVDLIELFNPSGSPVDISGWYLTDDRSVPQKFLIPNPTIIPANGQLVLTESNFNPGGTGFALDSGSDEVWLLSGDGTNLTGYAHGFHFEAANVGVSFGRYVNSAGEEDFVAQIAPSSGTANAGPRVGPVVFSEIMYHPLNLPDGTENDAGEYIELQNITGSAVPLYDPFNPTNTWRSRGAVDFDFPPWVVLQPGERIVVGQKPGELIDNYGAISTRMFGGYSRKLDNSGERLELQQPGVPETNGVPYVLIDAVNYRDSLPWPPGADGTGASLHRRSLTAYGNDPTNWVAATPSPGAPYVGGASPVITVQPVSQTVIAGSTATLSISAIGSTPLTYQWFFNGNPIAGATDSILALPNIQTNQAGLYFAAVLNSAGSAVSAPATLMVLPLPSIVAQPTNIAVRIRPDPQAALTTNATFRVNAASAYPPLSYQWRFNGVNISGATVSNYTVVNVQLTNEGAYTVVVTDAICSVVSAPAQLTPLITPTFVLVPVSQSVVVGGQVTLSAQVSGNPRPFGFEWRRQSTPLASNTLNSTVSYFGFTATNGVATQQFRVVVRNAAMINGVASPFASITTLADTDGDGLPDSWETANGLDPNASADAALDTDGDGMSNLAEYIAGTNPNDAGSYLKVERLTGTSPALVSFNAISNRTYTVEFTEALGSSPWATLADIVARPNNRLEVVPDPNFGTNRFYRLVTPKSP